MTAVGLYLLSGGALFAMGLFGLLATTHLLRKILAFNIMGAGVFMVLISLAHPARSANEAAGIDPIPHALVLTGIVVAVSATALALALTCRYCAETGRATLPEDTTG
ncbi:MAG: cation:proton antiporter subunit C [Planctomycetota bacterium]